ncbi:MAG: restriction endonuclease [Terriglobia bacterium]
MALSKMQEAVLTRVRAGGNSPIDAPLNDEVCSYLLSVIISDLGLTSSFPELPIAPSPFFTRDTLQSLRVTNVDFLALYDRLLGTRADADAYFVCLCKLHKARLKYERILQAQPIPTLDQVGPRSLLQFGTLSPFALAGLLFWRKWIFDIDNRAGQETGYLLEPIIAGAIGGVPFSSQKSPILRKPRRGERPDGRRQADCIREQDRRAYELKVRVTIAASGQGRWGEELRFPIDARYSGYTPVLVVLDPTENDKLTALSSAFLSEGGEVYIGDEAWSHLEEQAGPTMTQFIERYVRVPLQSLLDEAPSRAELPNFMARIEGGNIVLQVGAESLRIERSEQPELGTNPDALPEGVEDEM